MKNKIKPVLLIIIPFVVLSVLLGTRMVCGGTHGFLSLGVPAYFVKETTISWENPKASVERLELKGANIIIMHALLSVPIFISGYLWAKSKYKLPNKSSEPT